MKNLSEFIKTVDKDFKNPPLLFLLSKRAEKQINIQKNLSENVLIYDYNNYIEYYKDRDPLIIQQIIISKY